MTVLIKNPSYRTVLEDSSWLDPFLDWDLFGASVGASTRPDTIPVDIQETDSEYQLRAALPGIKKSDIQVSYQGEVLTLRIHSDHSSQSDTSAYLLREIQASSLERQFRVKGLDFDQASSSYKDGILELQLPKAAELKPRTLTIK